MRKRWKLWAAGLALVLLLALGAGAALLWPGPSEAERRAALIREGMTWDQVAELSRPSRLALDDHILEDIGSNKPPGDGREYRWGAFGDGSVLCVAFGPLQEGRSHAISIRTEPPSPVRPLTRLRRTLARVLPFLAD